MTRKCVDNRMILRKLKGQFQIKSLIKIFKCENVSGYIIQNSLSDASDAEIMRNHYECLKPIVFSFNFINSLKENHNASYVKIVLR